MQIASDPERREYIHTAPDSAVPLSYILKDLWPKLGFLPIDPENPGVALVAEFMLNELILKNSESLDELNLQHLKELFSGEDDDMEDDEEMGDMDIEQMAQREAIEAMEAMEGMDPNEISPGFLRLIEQQTKNEEAQRRALEQ